MKFAAGIIYAIIITIQARAILSKKLYHELAVYSVIIILAAIYTYGFILDLGIPGFSKPIDILFRPVAKILFSDYPN